MTKILIPSSGPDDWQQFLADPVKQWKRGYSAMAAALSWENANGLPLEIQEILGSQTELLFAIPEHKVALPGGGRQSQCDIFALIRNATTDETCALAVEAKVSEPFGPTLEEWLIGASPGKHVRLAALCDIVGLRHPPRKDLRYQLLHRTAAAVLEAERFKTGSAAMIVQSFSQNHLWFDDFEVFCEALGCPCPRGEAIQHMLPSGKRLVLGWATGNQKFL